MIATQSLTTAAVILCHMRPLAFSTNAFKKCSVFDAVDLIALTGYTSVEIMADAPHALPESFSDTDRTRLRQQLARHNVTISNVNAFTLFACGDTYHPTWIEEDVALRRRRIEHTRRALELAAAFDCKTVSIQPGGPLIGTSLSRTAASERFAEALLEVLPTARAHNVILAVEPEPGLLIQSADEYIDFKRTFFANEDLVRMNCDIGHLFCVGDDPADVIRRHADQIAHVHLEDIGKNRVHQHLVPGDGAIDFPSIFAALSDIRYNGHVTVELYPFENSPQRVAKRAIEHLAASNC